MTTEYNAYQIQDKFGAISEYYRAAAVSETYYNSDGLVVISDRQVRSLCREIIKYGDRNDSVNGLFRKIVADVEVC